MSCACVEKHVPLPVTTKSLRVGKEVLDICPTSWYNVMELMTAFKMHGTVPPGRVTKHYSRYVREICLRLWKENQKM
jgi:hypothetical protein